MKAMAFVCDRPRHIELRETALGETPPDGVLVANEFTLVSVGTELWNYRHGAEPGREPVFPRTTGYCNAGRVLAVGAEVKGVREGDRVAGLGAHASHEIMRDGFYRIPDSLDTRYAVFMTMGAIALRGARVARIELGESVGVLGLGLVGLLATALAKASGGVPVIAIDKVAFRLDRARQCGADVLINSAETPDLVAAVRAHCVEDGVNVLIESTGIPAVYPSAVKLPCEAGRLVALGSPRGEVMMDFFSEVHLREVAILGAFQPFTPQQGNRFYPWDVARERHLVLRLMAEGRLPVEPLITHTHRPGECHDVYERLASGAPDTLGVLFDWRGLVAG